MYHAPHYPFGTDCRAWTQPLRGDLRRQAQGRRGPRRGPARARPVRCLVRQDPREQPGCQAQPPGARQARRTACRGGDAYRRSCGRNGARKISFVIICCMNIILPRNSQILPSSKFTIVVRRDISLRIAPQESSSKKLACDILENLRIRLDSVKRMTQIQNTS